MLQDVMEADGVVHEVVAHQIGVGIIQVLLMKSLRHKQRDI